jgi:hypothetical protein
VIRGSEVEECEEEHAQLEDRLIIIEVFVNQDRRMPFSTVTLPEGWMEGMEV